MAKINLHSSAEQKPLLKILDPPMICSLLLKTGNTDQIALFVLYDVCFDGYYEIM